MPIPVMLIWSSTFCEIPPFRPYPLLRSGHAQTIFSAVWWQKPLPYAAVRHETLLDDGDRIVLHDDRPAAWKPGEPAVLLVHGLSGTHLSPYVAHTAAKLNARGVRAFRMDLRGCGAGLDLAAAPLHAGRSGDTAAALATVATLCPDSLLVAVGYSLGGNIILKMAAEMGEAYPAYLRAVIAVAPPIDLARTCRNLAEGWNSIYDRSFVRAMMRHMAQRRERLPHARHIILARPPRGMYEFDDQIVAPLSGFAGAEEYYARSSAGPLLSSIRVPTLILAASDDPLVPVGMFEECSPSSSVKLHITDRGGHVGYLAARSADPDRRWLDWRIVEQVRHLHREWGVGSRE
jgi:predicted alpha/beta-fold hydrolase